MRLILVFIMLTIMLIGCSGGDDDAVLPTRVSISSSVETTVEPMPEVTDAVVAEVTPEATDDNDVEITPEVTPEGLAVSTEPEIMPETTPALNDSGDTIIIQNWDQLILDEIVTIGATIVIDENENGEQIVNLIDLNNNVLPLALPADQLQSLNGERIEVTGFLESDDDVGLQFVPAQDQLTTIVEEDPFVEIIAAQQDILDVTVDASLPALQIYNQILPSIEPIITDFDLIVVAGSPVAGWSYEFVSVDGADRYRFSVNVEDQVSVNYNAQSILPPELPQVPLVITPTLLDSDEIYAQLDLTDVPNFAIPTVQLFADEDQEVFWAVNDNSGRIFPASAE